MAADIEKENTMKNTLTDLNNHLFEALERLNEDEMSAEELDRELKRAECMGKIAEQIIRNGELAFKTMKHMDEYGHNIDKNTVPPMLEIRDKSKEIKK